MTDTARMKKRLDDASSLADAGGRGTELARRELQMLHDDLGTILTGVKAEYDRDGDGVPAEEYLNATLNKERGI